MEKQSTVYRDYCWGIAHGPKKWLYTYISGTRSHTDDYKIDELTQNLVTLSQRLEILDLERLFLIVIRLLQSKFEQSFSKFEQVFHSSRPISPRNLKFWI